MHPRLSPHPSCRLTWSLAASYRLRNLHSAGRHLNRKDRVRRQKAQKVPLFEELFPEETRKRGDCTLNSEEKCHDVPRLPLPEVGEGFEENHSDFDRSRVRSGQVASQATAEAFRQEKLAVLVLQIASKSLIEGDFRLVAPKGEHIARWTGPGELLKVIPMRDSQTLECAGYYFMLFPNPAYARAYQGHVLHLHRMAKTHTPTSIESPLPLESGMVVGGEGADAILQDYALCPPSQDIQLKLLYPQYTRSTKQLLDQRGYRQLVEENDKTGRSVLCRVEGQQLTTAVIRNTMAADGRERGLAWGMSIEKIDNSTTRPDDGDCHGLEENGSPELRTQRSDPMRWILSFTDESQARSFIRAWHRRAFPAARGDGPSLVHAELMW